MNILMVLKDSSGFPPEARVEAEARSLSRAGHRVHLLCALREGQEAYEYINGAEVMRVALPSSMTGKASQLLLKAGISGWRNPYWLNKIREATESVEADVLHIHDLPLVATGLEAARSYDIPLVADLHELYPDAIKTYYLGWPGQTISTLGRWTRREKQALEESTVAITISEGARDYYERKYRLRRPPEVVSNYVDLERWDSLPIEDIGIGEGPWVMYEGSYNPSRGMDTLLRAMHDVPEAKLLLIGSYPPNIVSRAHCTGWVDDSTFPSYFAKASVLVHPVKVMNPQIDYCCPHKIFEYMASGKPIVASDAYSFKDYIYGVNAGVLFRSGDHRELAAGITLMLKHGERHGHNGRRAVEERFNWESQGKKLVEIYSKLR